MRRPGLEHPHLVCVHDLRRRVGSDAGSAVAEFPLLAALLTLFLVVTIQAAVFMHVRNSTIDAAVQGARAGSLVGSTLEDGEQRTHDVLTDRFGEGYVSEVTARRTPDGVITVDVRTALPVVGWYGPAGVMEVSGSAIDEDEKP